MVNLSSSFNPYGHAHQLRRRGIASLVTAGLVNCARCGKRIKPGDEWDLGHRDDSNHTEYSGPEHRACNRATARHRYLRRLKVSRQW
jgi:hypothetical protein